MSKYDIFIHYIRHFVDIPKELDAKDEAILTELAGNARASTTQIARSTGIARVTVHDRIQRLERRGIIEGYRVRLNYERIGLPITAFILVKTNFENPFNEIATRIGRLRGVYSVHSIAGNYDLIVKVRVSTMNEISTLIIDQMRQIEGIDMTTTLMVLRSTFKEE